VPGDINQLGPRLAQFLSVLSTTSEIDTSAQDSIAQQALEQSGIALATAQQALAATPNVRSNGPFAIATGDSALNINWSPAFPNTNYSIFGTYYGTTAYPGQYFAFHIVDGSRTVTGCELRFNNTPAGFKFAWVASALPQP
jgi:hypothetical protein